MKNSYSQLNASKCFHKYTNKDFMSSLRRPGINLILYRTVSYCIVLYETILYYIVLYWTVLWYVVLFDIVLYYIGLSNTLACPLNWIILFFSMFVRSYLVRHLTERNPDRRLSKTFGKAIELEKDNKERCEAYSGRSKRHVFIVRIHDTAVQISI